MNCDTWPTPDEGCVAGCDIPEDTDSDLLESAAIQAGVILYTLSGGRVGLCVDTVRPIPECGTCRGSCRCSNTGDRIRLYSSAGPISGVGEVTIDGDILDTSEYRFYPSSQMLYRAPPGVWPTQDLKWSDCGDPDTMCVQVLVGTAPDAWALAVHAELTCELLKACSADQKCRIPRNATQVTGQGITVTMSPDQLKTFIPSVSAWVAAINPHGATGPALVSSPDVNPSWDTGGGTPGGEVGPFPPWDIDGGWA